MSVAGLCKVTFTCSFRGDYGNFDNYYEGEFVFYKNTRLQAYEVSTDFCDKHVI